MSNLVKREKFQFVQSKNSKKKLTREMKRRKQYFVTFGFRYDNVKRRERREFYDGSRK